MIFSLVVTKYVVYLYSDNSNEAVIVKLKIMKLSVTNTVTKEVTTHASMKLAKMFIEQQVEWLNEEESEKPKTERHYYTELDFKISE